MRLKIFLRRPFSCRWNRHAKKTFQMAEIVIIVDLITIYSNCMAIFRVLTCFNHGIVCTNSWQFYAVPSMGSWGLSFLHHADQPVDFRIEEPKKWMVEIRHHPNRKTDTNLVGGWATPLKNMSQLG